MKLPVWITRRYAETVEKLKKTTTKTTSKTIWDSPSVRFLKLSTALMFVENNKVILAERAYHITVFLIYATFYTFRLRKCSDSKII